METTRFETSAKVLVDGVKNETLMARSLYRCAVANLIAHANGIKLHSYPLMEYPKVMSEWFNDLLSAKFEKTNHDNFYGTGYDAVELDMVTVIFDNAICEKYSESGAIKNGVIKVLEYLCALDDADQTIKNKYISQLN